MRIERGIREIQWKTKDGTQVKFQVRIKRKDFQADRVFDSLKAARDFVSLAKSKDGQLALTEQGQRAKLAEEFVAAYLKSPTMETYLRQYFLRYLKDESTPTKKLSSSAYDSKIRTICATKIKTNPKPLTGLVAMWKQHAKGNITQNFGDLKPEDVNEQIATDFIVERLKTVAVSTAQREVFLMQGFFNKLRYLDNETWKRLKANPFKEADKSLLKTVAKKRKRRLSDDEEVELFKALRECKNSEMMEIVGIALSTGMRRGEILELKWKNIKEHVIEVEQAKAGAREVVLNSDAKLILEIAKKRKKDERIFHYTPDGFASNWDRVKKRAKIENFRFHDCRREFISRLVETISNPMVIAEMSTLRDVNHIEKYYLEPLRAEESAERGITTEAELLRSVGHKDRTTTALYFTRKPAE
jgi:integrase